MKITIESTDVLTTIDGVPVRLWRGQTENGIAVRVFAHRIEVEAGVDTKEFRAALLAMERPDELRRRDLSTIPWML